MKIKMEVWVYLKWNIYSEMAQLSSRYICLSHIGHSSWNFKVTNSLTLNISCEKLCDLVPFHPLRHIHRVSRRRKSPWWRWRSGAAGRRRWRSTPRFASQMCLQESNRSFKDRISPMISSTRVLFVIITNAQRSYRKSVQSMFLKPDVCACDKTDFQSFAAIGSEVPILFSKST